MTNKPTSANMRGLLKPHQVDIMNRLLKGPKTVAMPLVTDPAGSFISHSLAKKLARVHTPLVIKPRGKP